MRVLLTGAGGFIGREIARELRARGHVVAGLMRHAEQCVAPDDFPADILRPESYRGPFARFAPDALIHAGWSGVAPRTRDLRNQMSNVPAMVEIYEQAVVSGARIVIGLGTQAEYGLTTEPVDEDAPTRPVSLYGIAKLAAGASLLRLARQAGQRGVWGRVFGVYGPGETAPSMLPWLAREFSAGRSPQLTPCMQRWDYLHVRDVARAFALLLECENAEGNFNIASGAAPPLRETVLLLRDVMGSDIAPAFGAVPFGPEQVMHLGGVNAKLVAATGWRPAVAMTDGLRQVAEEARAAAREAARLV